MGVVRRQVHWKQQQQRRRRAVDAQRSECAVATGAGSGDACPARARPRWARLPHRRPTGTLHGTPAAHGRWLCILRAPQCCAVRPARRPGHAPHRPRCHCTAVGRFGSSTAGMSRRCGVSTGPSGVCLPPWWAWEAAAPSRWCCRAVSPCPRCGPATRHHNPAHGNATLTTTGELAAGSAMTWPWWLMRGVVITWQGGLEVPAPQSRGPMPRTTTNHHFDSARRCLCGWALPQ